MVTWSMRLEPAGKKALEKPSQQVNSSVLDQGGQQEVMEVTVPGGMYIAVKNKEVKDAL